MARSSLLRTLDELITLQIEQSFILAGFLLPLSAVEELQVYLTVDDPPIGAIGRYQNVPVFDDSAEIKDVVRRCRRSEFNGIKYFYVAMGVVN